jgi:hypothetical protein
MSTILVHRLSNMQLRRIITPCRSSVKRKFFQGSCKKIKPTPPGMHLYSENPEKGSKNRRKNI